MGGEFMEFIDVNTFLLTLVVLELGLIYIRLRRTLPLNPDKKP